MTSTPICHSFGRRSSKTAWLVDRTRASANLLSVGRSGKEKTMTIIIRSAQPEIDFPQIAELLSIDIGEPLPVEELFEEEEEIWR
jgi:hypothetical protein